MADFNEISNFFETEFPLNQEGLEELFSLFTVQIHKKGSLLIQAQTVEKQLRFLNKGVVREYYSNEEKEININFYVKPQFISDLLMFSQNSKTNKNQECLSSVEVLCIDRQPFFDLLERYQCGKLHNAKLRYGQCSQKDPKILLLITKKLSNFKCN